jgi:hypothetical protein
VAAPPEHWLFRDGPSAPGRAVVVDIDGVLSNAASRQHYLEEPIPDWEGFFDACGDDPIIEEMHRLLDLLDRELRIVLLTARPGRVRPMTHKWLVHYGFRWDVLVMRPWGDYLSARAFKRESVRDLRTQGYELALAFEDDPRNVDMFRGEGIPCVYIHSGYYG